MIRYSDVLGYPNKIKTLADPEFILNVNKDEIILPIGKDISEYLIFVNSITEDSSWRYIEIDKMVIENQVDPLHISDILSLPRADSRADFDILWKMYDDAVKIYERECSKLPGTNKL